MFPNLNAEMARQFMTALKLSDLTGIPYSTLTPKLAGKTPLKFWEAKAIKAALKTEIPLEVLFEEKDDDLFAGDGGLE
jgi:hypothetical protein